MIRDAYGYHDFDDRESWEGRVRQNDRKGTLWRVSEPKKCTAYARCASSHSIVTCRDLLGARARSRVASHSANAPLLLAKLRHSMGMVFIIDMESCAHRRRGASTAPPAPPPSRGSSPTISARSPSTTIEQGHRRTRPAYPPRVDTRAGLGRRAARPRLHHLHDARGPRPSAGHVGNHITAGDRGSAGFGERARCQKPSTATKQRRSRATPQATPAT